MCLRVLAATMLVMTVGTSHRTDAAFITYTQTTTASGTLGGVAFVNAAITFTQTADTANIVGAFPGPIQVANLTSTVMIEGLGLATFSMATTTFINGGLTAGVGRSSDARAIIASLNPPAFIGYDLRTPIGPVVGSGLFDPSASFATDRGLLILSSALPVTFQASLGTSAIPEPSSLALCGIASLIGLFIGARRRHAGSSGGQIDSGVSGSVENFSGS